MALQVWLPLNKDLRNQGLSNTQVTNYGVTLVEQSNDGTSTRKITEGKIGNCYNFSNGYIAIPEIVIPLNADEWSYAAWVRLDDMTWTSSTFFCIFSQRTGGNTNGYTIFLCPGLKTVKIDDGVRWEPTNITFEKNKWFHFVVTRSLEGKKLYINGELIASTSTIGTATAGGINGCVIGRAQDTNSISSVPGSYQLKGDLNDIRIYDHCLSSKEVKEISKGLVLHYKMNGTVENSENLAPFFSHPLDDISSGFFNETYWVDWNVGGGYKKLLDYANVLSNGWVHFEYAHSNATTDREFVIFPPISDNFGAIINEQYTVMLEIKNFQGENIDRGNFSSMSASGLKVYGAANNGGLTALFFSDMINQSINGEGIFYLPCYINGQNYSAVLANYWLCPVFIFFPNEKVSLDFRLSVYQGEYNGPYKSYYDKNILGSPTSGSGTGTIQSTTNSDFLQWYQKIYVSAYDTYKVTFDAKTSDEDAALLVYLYNNSSNIVQCSSVTNSQGFSGTGTDGVNKFYLTESFLTYSATWKFNNSVNSANKTLLFRAPASSQVTDNEGYEGETITVKNVRLEKISGNEPDCSGYNNNGERTGLPTLATDTVKYDASTKLTAAFDYIRCGRGGMVSDGITVNLWVKYTTSTNVNSISCTEGGGWNFENNGGYIQFACYVAGVGYKSVKSSVALSSLEGSWHMLTGIYDGQYTKIYVDGILKGTVDTGSANNKIAYHASNAIFIGAEASGNALAPATNSTFIGNISDVRVYATPLSEPDILELYHTGASVDNDANLFTGEVVE